MTPFNQSGAGSSGLLHPLFDDVLGLKIGVQEALPTWAFAIVQEREMVLIDSLYGHVLPAIQSLIAEGLRPMGLLLTHRHVLGTGDLDPRALARDWDIPVLLHPDDARHRQAAPFGPFENPVDHPLLAHFKMRALPFPGHTEGHVLYHLDRHGGVLFAGDSAMGVQDGSDQLAFVRPPAFFNVDDGRLRESWSAIDLQIRTFAPFHGKAAIDRDDLETLTAKLTRMVPTRDFTTA